MNWYFFELKKRRDGISLKKKGVVYKVYLPYNRGLLARQNTNNK